MKTLISNTRAGRSLGLVASILTLVSGFSATAANLLIVNETYDPPTLPTPGGWTVGTVEDLSWQYVAGGVGGSTALQISATLPGPGYSAVYSELFQSGVIGGNEWATRGNTVLSFDIKIDSPGLSYIGVFLDAFAEYAWNYSDIPNATYSGAAVGVAIGSYTPGVFKRIVLPLNDPRWFQIGGPWLDPSAKTYNNLALVVDSDCLASPGSFTVTVDNVQVTTKSPMVPFNGTGEGSIAADGSVVLTGVAEHMGSFKQTAVFPPDVWGPGTFEFTAANDDKLRGSIHQTLADFGIQIDGAQCTGRFAGAVGSYRGVTSQDPISGAVTATFKGGISSVGSNK